MYHVFMQVSSDFSAIIGINGAYFFVLRSISDENDETQGLKRDWIPAFEAGYSFRAGQKWRGV
jgi:hypothetical protein